MGQRRGTLYKAAFGLTGILLCLTVWFLYMAVGSNTQQLRVSFLDVGQGEAMLIETPSGTETLIDTGRSGSVSRPLSSRLPFYDRTMDMVIATHADSDHIGALPAVLADYRVGVVLPPAQTKSTAAWQAAAAAIQA